MTHLLYDEGCNYVDVLPKIFFSRSKDGSIEQERVTIMDRYGVDVTRLFDPIKYTGFEYYLDAGFAKAKLRFGRGDWHVSCPQDMTNRVEVTNPSGYNLVVGLEINSIVELYPTDRKPEIEITFDVEWGT